jgi:hypothetical protein
MVVIAARVLRRSRIELRQTVEPHHLHHIAGTDLDQQLAKLGLVGLGPLAASCNTFPAPGRARLARLRQFALLARRYPCIAVYHEGGPARLLPHPHEEARDGA